MFKKILILFMMSIVLAGCFRYSYQYKTNKLTLGYLNGSKEYTDEDVSFLIMELEDEFTVKFNNYGRSANNKEWPVKQIKEDSLKDTIVAYIKEHHHIISEYEDKTGGRVIVFNTAAGVVAKYAYKTNEFTLFMVDSDDVEIKGNFKYYFTFPIDYQKEVKYEIHDDKIVIITTEFDPENVYSWFEDFCDGHYVGSDFIFSYIKYDFKLSYTETETEVTFIIEPYEVNE